MDVSSTHQVLARKPDTSSSKGLYRLWMQEEDERSVLHEVPSRPAQGVLTGFSPSALARGKSTQQPRVENSRHTTPKGSVELVNSHVLVVLGSGVTVDEMVVTKVANHPIEVITSKSGASDMPLVASIEELTLSAALSSVKAGTKSSKAGNLFPKTSSKYEFYSFCILESWLEPRAQPCGMTASGVAEFDDPVSSSILEGSPVSII
ncbi:hypothetical protein V6N13_020602 [Hibiscus sabdariffa]